jgi:hypothetical protein
MLRTCPWLVAIRIRHTYDDELGLLTIESLKEQVSVRTGNPMLIPSVVEY